MRIQKLVVLTVLLFLPTTSARAVTRDETVASLRVGLAKIGAMVEQLSALPFGPAWRPVDDAQRLLVKEPRELLREAIDLGIREGGKDERTGSFFIYRFLVSAEHELPNSSFKPFLLALLAKDDLSSFGYTEALAGVLYQFPSRETALAYMDVAARAREGRVREHFLEATAGLFEMDLGISLQTKPLEKEKIYSDFEAWFDRNKDRIRFNEEGEFRLAGGEAREARLELSAEDRARIRKDPVCVLRLVNSVLGDLGKTSEAKVMELNSKCGVALFGAEGATVLSKAGAASQEGMAPSLDLQAAMASSQGKHPVMDAVLLAVAYVAAYEKDPQALKLAKETLDQFMSPEMDRVLKGEPRLVRKKAEELAEEVREEGGS